MVKYSFEFKLKVVKSYLAGEGGTPYLAKHYNIPNESQVRRWINSYNLRGERGLQRKTKNKSYASQFNLNAVNLYLTSDKSYRTVAEELDIHDSGLATLN